MFTRPFSFPTPTQKKEKGLATRDYDTKLVLKLQLPCKQASFVRQIEQYSVERYRSGITTLNNNTGHLQYTTHDSLPILLVSCAVYSTVTGIQYL